MTTSCLNQECKNDGLFELGANLAVSAIYAFKEIIFQIQIISLESVLPLSSQKLKASFVIYFQSMLLFAASMLTRKKFSFQLNQSYAPFSYLTTILHELSTKAVLTISNFLPCVAL